MLSGKLRGGQRSPELSYASQSAAALNGAVECQKAPIKKEMSSNVLPAKKKKKSLFCLLLNRHLNHSLAALPSSTFYIVLPVAVNSRTLFVLKRSE